MAQAAFALQGHLKVLAAQQPGTFADEVTPVQVIERMPHLALGAVLGGIDIRARSVSLDEVRAPRPRWPRQACCGLCLPHGSTRQASPPAAAA